MAILRPVVVITGASSGFGRLSAETLARRNYTVVATMRNIKGKNAPASEELLALARRDSLDLHTAEMDVTREESVETAIRETIERTGRIDVLVNNAGYPNVGLTETFTVEQAQRIFDTNLFGVVRTIRAVLPHMHRERRGLLLQVSSGAGRVVLPAMGFYTATKFALEALTEAYRYELAGAGIDSVSVQPGAYPTEIFGKAESGADAARQEPYGAAREIPDKVMGALASSTADPMEVAEAIVRIIETPAGQRHLRYRVGTGATGVETINAVAAEVQSGLLAAFGLQDLTRFRAPAAGKS